MYRLIVSMYLNILYTAYVRETEREREKLIKAGKCPVLIADALLTLPQLQTAFDLCSNWQSRKVYTVL